MIDLWLLQSPFWRTVSAVVFVAVIAVVFGGPLALVEDCLGPCGVIVRWSWHRQARKRRTVIDEAQRRHQLNAIAGGSR
jgi:hypothetical protein